jgi:hypothetical protein
LSSFIPTFLFVFLKNQNRTQSLHTLVRGGHPKASRAQRVIIPPLPTSYTHSCC